MSLFEMKCIFNYNLNLGNFANFAKFWLLPFPHVQGHIVDTLGLLTMIYNKCLVCINIYFYRLISGIIYNCVIFSFTNNLEQRWIAREHNVMKVIQGSMKCKEAIKP